MHQKILIILLFILLVSAGVLYYLFDKKRDGQQINQFEAVVGKSESDDLQEFLYENKGKFVKLSITLSHEMRAEVARGMDEDNRIVFTALDGENRAQNIQYLIRVPDDGRRDFDFDPSSGELSGYFKTFRRVSADGSPIVNLIPISAHFLPQNAIKKSE